MVCYSKDYKAKTKSEFAVNNDHCSRPVVFWEFETDICCIQTKCSQFKLLFQEQKPSFPDDVRGLDGP